MDIEKIYAKLERKVDQAAVHLTRSRVTQIRFSNNQVDISNEWNEEFASIFLAKNGRTFMFDLKREADLEKMASLAISALDSIEKNEDFFSLYDRKGKYRKKDMKDERLREIVGLDFVNDYIEEVKPFVKRVGGVFYKREEEDEILTPFNSGKGKQFGIEFVARAFDDTDYPVQTSIATSTDDDIPELNKQADEALDLGRKVRGIREGREGKYKVIFSPLCFASIVSYTIPMASAFQIDSGMSVFSDRMGQKIGNANLTIYDDPSDDTMFASRVFDDEGSSTRKTPVVEKGVVRNFLHNFSTAKKYGVETTGNAGIVSPSPWQISVEPGTEDLDDMISSTKAGLFINNTWYTRFQDYREGIFSTIPRDGIFYIENGEIVESWGGIRISDSLIRMYKNIEGMSRETRKVKWWDETMYTKSPFVEVADVNISRSR
ncbi:MAG: TldD/PmbA family protein [Candidatus Thermoplasmatota archaeon]|jgi:PmbA protein|nr:TldD/PmbA family protein [Candidatus Thermoplasmatota archaeon]